MKLLKKGIVSGIAAVALTTGGITTVSADTSNVSANKDVQPSARPVSASMSPANQSGVSTGSMSFTRTLSWGGGTTNTYVISYFEGIILWRGTTPCL